jgi:hypothetical protein
LSPLTVGHVHAAVRRHLARSLGRVGLAWAGVVVAVALLAAWIWAGPEGWRAGSAGPLVLDALFGVILVTGGWWLVRRRRDALAERRVARGMEQAAGLPGGSVVGSIELSRGVPPGVSPSLADHAQRSLAARLDLPAPTLAGHEGRTLAKWSRGGLRALALLLPLLVLAWVAAPRRSFEAWRGLGTPFGLLAGPTLPPLVVEPGDVELMRGRALAVVVRAPGRDSVTLHWQGAGDVARTAGLPVVEERAGHVFAEVTAAIEYWASAPDGARSATFTVTPVDPLFVTDVTVRLVFPAYTGRSSEEYRGETPALEVPVGTRVRIEGRASRPLSRAELVPEGVGRDAEAVATFQRRGAEFSGGFVPRRSGRYGWRFADADGGGAELSPSPLDITLVADLAPVVEITLPGADTVLPISLKQPLVIQAADDYGVEWLELVAWRVTALGEAQPPVRQRIELGGVPGALARPLMDVSRWELLAGDQVRYFARVVDNAPTAQEASTREYVLRMPDASRLRREAQEELDRGAEELETLAERARRGAEEARDLERQARAPDRSSDDGDRQPSGEADAQVAFEEREDLRRALEEQEAMAARVDSLRRELGALSETLQEAGAQDPGLRDDLAELQRLLEEVAGPELQEKLRELAERMNDMDRQRAREALEELAREEETFQQRLEQALDRMKRAAVQQDFRATTEEARELAREEEALAAALEEEGDDDLRARQQDELGERAGEMDERMERLQERLDELGEPDAATGVEEARQRAAEAMASMDEAARQARQGRRAQAGERAGEAAGQMSEAARQLQEAQQQMMQERAEALRRALQQTTQDALSLARRQGEIRESMRGASPQELADLRADVAALQQGVRNMAENLSVAARSAGASGAERDIGTSLGQAMGALERTVAALDAPSSASRSPATTAEQAVDALNQVALRAVAAARSLSEGGQSAASAEQMMEALERLAQQQADVNNQASQMMPMQLSPQALQQQMQEMAQGQQSVASDLGDLSNQEGEGPLGDLEALAAEAEALARELTEGRLEPDTRRRQERLFHRLLDAGRSLENDELSEERESAAAGAFERGDIAELDRDALGLLRFRAPDAESLRRLPPAARALVLQYFQRLNRAGTGDPQGPPGSGR